MIKILFSKSMRERPGTEKLSRAPTSDIMVKLRGLLTKKIDTFSPLRGNALTLCESTEVTLRFATGVKKPKLQELDGDGLLPKMSGTDGTWASGTTGVHQREVSQPLDGLGIKDTGIMVAMYSNTGEANGIDSKVKNGSSTRERCQLNQPCQEHHQSADHSSS